MTIAAILKYAGYALQVYQGLRKLAETRGMPPGEFDAKAQEECQRLDRFVTEVDDAISSVFDSDAG